MVEQGLLQACPGQSMLLKTAEAEESSETLLSTTGKLHISLTRPFTVRAHERDEYVKTAWPKSGAFHWDDQVSPDSSTPGCVSVKGIV